MTEVVLSGLTGDGKDHRYGSFRWNGDAIEVSPHGDPILERILRKPIPVGGSDTWVRADREPEAWLKALPLQYRSAYLQAWEALGEDAAPTRGGLTLPQVAPSRQGKSLLHFDTKAIVSGYDSMGRRYCRDHGRSIPCGQAASTEKDERNRADARTIKPGSNRGDSLGIGQRTGKPVVDPTGGPAGQVTPPNVSFGCDTSEAMTEVASADGWEVIRDHLLNLPDAPEVQNLATEGISHDPMTLAAELEAQVASEGDSDVGLILNALLDLLGETPDATEAMVEGGHLDTAGRDEEEQEPAEKVDLVTDILAGTFGEEELKEASEGEDQQVSPQQEEEQESEQQQAYPEKSLPNYFVKARGQPCKRGEAASRTGCIPKVKPTPKKRNTQASDQSSPLQREPLQPPSLESRQESGDEQQQESIGEAPPNPDQLVEKRSKTKRKTPEEKKKQIADMVERINGLRNRHNHTAQDVTDLAKALGDELTVRQLDELKRTLDFPASGRKKVDYARKIAERSLGRPAMEAPTPPSPAPSMQGIAAPPQEEAPVAEATPVTETLPLQEQEPPHEQPEQQATVPEEPPAPEPVIGQTPSGEPVVDQDAIEEEQQQPQEQTPEPVAEEQSPNGNVSVTPPEPEVATDEAAAEVAEMPPESPAESAHDQQLAEGLRKDGREYNAAVSDLVKTYQRRLLGIIKRKVKDPGAAEDIMQEAYISLLKTLPTFDPAKGTLRNFLFTATLRRCYDYLRKSGRSKEQSGVGGEQQAEGGADALDTADTRAQAPDEIAMQSETAKRREDSARRAVDTISKQWRAKGKELEADVWDMAWDGSTPVKDIAKQFGINPQKVSNITAAARKRAVALLKEYDPQEFDDGQ